jgi:hypothetical protein
MEINNGVFEYYSTTIALASSLLPKYSSSYVLVLLVACTILYCGTVVLFIKEHTVKCIIIYIYIYLLVQYKQ